MGQMKREQEHRDDVRAIAEEILVKVGYFARCRHETLVVDSAYRENRNHAMAEATNYSKKHGGYTQAELTAAVSDVIMDNGLCGQCEADGDDD